VNNSPGNILRRFSIIDSIIGSRGYERIRHAIALRRDKRENSTFTGFLRLPTQFKALTGPVIDFILEGGQVTPIRIFVFGCSNGAEVYTIASSIKKTRPGLGFEIFAYDIDEKIIEKARSAVYGADEIYNNKIITESFIRDTFDIDGDKYRVKPEITASVTFVVDDVLKMESQSAGKKCDIAFAQNFLFHLERGPSREALRNIIKTTKDRAALFIDGVDVDIRTKVTKSFRLRPLDFEIEKIYEEVLRARALGWPYSYWGAEPVMRYRGDWKRRYSTIFLRR